MPNLSQLKRERMLAFLQKIKDEHRDDDDMLIALGEITGKSVDADVVDRIFSRFCVGK